MKSNALSLLALTALMAIGVSAFPTSAGEPAKKPEPLASYVLSKVRILPKSGAAGVLAGARITGSNLNATNGFVELAKIDKAPADGRWIEVAVDGREVYRFVKVEAAPGTLLAVAELEFYSSAGKLPGKPFGTDTGKDGAAKSADKAFDGDPATAFEAPIDNAYVGLDLGGDCQTPQPFFQPGRGVYAQPQKVKLHMWPPGPTVRYTTDGSTPSRTHGEIYKDLIDVSANTSIAAIAYQDGKADSRVAVASYLFGAGLGPQIKTYHIGNSLTDTTKGTLDAICMSGGKNVLTYYKTIPGCSLIGNWKSNGQGFGYPEAWGNDYEKVCQQKLDHLFLQPFPNPPGLLRDGNSGASFIKLARQSNPDVQPWLYAQWISWPAVDAKGKVVAAYCGQIGGQSWDKEEPEAWMPPIPTAKVKTWEDAMANTMDYYRTILKRWNKMLDGGKPVRLVPGGPALLRLKKAIEAGQLPGVKDFGAFAFSDAIHMTRGGAYLIGLVHYACMFGESPEGRVTWATSGLSKEQAQVLQRIAWETVISDPDSGVKGK